MRPRWNLRAMLIALPVGTVLLSVIFPACDAVSHGPYATWYNRKCQRLADDARLVGRPEEDIIGILGPPTFFYGAKGSREQTYNYAPFSMFPAGKFQVHCQDGIVVSVEQLDD